MYQHDEIIYKHVCKRLHHRAPHLKKENDPGCLTRTDNLIEGHFTFPFLSLCREVLLILPKNLLVFHFAFDIKQY